MHTQLRKKIWELFSFSTWLLHNQGHIVKLDNSFSDAIPKGPLRNITCRLTDQSSKMKKKKTKKINNNETQKKKTSV